MKRLLVLIIAFLERPIPLLGIKRLGARRAAAVLLATAAHLVPIGGANAGWDPVTTLLNYWIELALVCIVLLAVVAVGLVSRLAGAKKASPDIWDDIPGLGYGWKVKAFILAAWIVFFAILMYGNLQMLGAIAQSHYGLENLSMAFSRLARGFMPPTGGIIAFLSSESASLSLMVISSAVSLWFQFSYSGGITEGRGAYVFAVKPLVRLMAMLCVFGIAMGFGSPRFPAMATVISMAIAMSLIDQRIELIDHDFEQKESGDPRYETPHGALLAFGAKIFVIMLGVSMILQFVFAEEQFARIKNNPMTVYGTIIRSRVPDEEDTMTIQGGYWWHIDVEYAAAWDPKQRYVLRDVKVHLPSSTDPTGGSIRLLHESCNPRNAFVDVPEDRERPGQLLIGGIFIILIYLGAGWFIRVLSGGSS